MVSLSPTQMIIFVIVFVVGFGIFQIFTLKDKIFCTFIRKDRTEINKYAKANQGRIDFDNSYYNIIPNRTTLKLVWVFIFPTWIRCLKFKFDSNMPIDPTTWNNDYDNPADRKALDKTEDLRALFETQKNTLSSKNGKKSFLEGLMPILTIAGFLIIGYLVWKQGQKSDQLGYAMNTVQSQFLDLMKALGK
jgi:hypothetical protein